MEERDAALDELRNQLLRAQNHMKKQADQNRREVEFPVGELVYLKIQPYMLKSLATRINQKISPRYYGPFKIVERMGAVAYKLKLPPGSQVHPVFHVALLKKCVSATAVTQALPTALTTDWELKVEPLEALAIRKNSQG